jgi:prolipoprotein diacylglyceryl transferase
MIVNRSIPTPSFSQFEVGPLTVHLYALCIIAGIAIAIWLGNKRFASVNSDLQGVVSEVAVIAVPSGIIGGRLYHVISSPSEYFGENGNLINIFKIWQGGLGIWGAISLGALGAYFSYRRLARTVSLPSFGVFLDAIAPGILFAQAIGRFGNWFNAELFGRPLDTWWGLEIAYRDRPRGFGLFETFHPTFAYEAIWSSLIAILLIRYGKYWSAGATFAAYVSAYSFGRFFIESIRIDPAELLGGLRINQWVSALIFILASAIFLKFYRREQSQPR